jgi:TRL (tRNA-associated locus)-like protein
MRHVFALGVISLGWLSLTGCQPVASPLMGVFYNETKYGYLATTESGATKEGKACAQTVMGLVATGDASIAAAKAAGGITTVSYIDHSAKSVLGITGEWCTIVKGK